MSKHQIIHGDNLVVMNRMHAEGQRVQFVLCSPPYEDARVYGELKYHLKGQAWVDWMVPRVLAALRICDGLCCFVVEGRTRNFSWSGTPHLLAADLIRAGATLRHDIIYRKSCGSPGSGGPDYFRNDFEFIICCTNGGKLPNANPLACAKPPKYRAGGEFSNRSADGTRANKYDVREYPSELKLANPGNVITESTNVLDISVGGGHMGSPLASENEAPYPEAIAERLIPSFTNSGDIVLDPFCGSGTTGKVALKLSRRFIGIDCRTSQVELSTRRMGEV